MRKNLIVLAIFASSWALNAQEKVEEVVSDKYDRNGLSVVVVTRGDMFDAPSVNFVNKLVVDEKFDVNQISTKTVEVIKDRSLSITRAQADSLVENSDIAKEILGFIYNRRPDGSMDDELLRHRGLYNATDQDIINLDAAKVKEQYLEWGEQLVGSSYVVLLDFTKIQRSENTDGEKNEMYECEVNAFVYKMDCSREKLDEFYTTSWVNAEDPQEIKNAANEAFEDFELNMGYVASANAKSESLGLFMSNLGADLKGLFKGKNTEVKIESGEEVTDTLSSVVFAENTVEFAQNIAYESAMAQLENIIPEWQVAVSIASTNPLKAKIGKKEGLSNGKRYRAYSFAEDEEGNLVSEKRGYLRATKVSDNRGVSTGETESSEFYQISGVVNIKEGWTIRQQNDLKLGVSLTGKIGGMSTFAMGVDIDYLMNISRLGSAYALLSMGTDVLDYTRTVGSGDYTYSNFNFGVGLGYGFHVGRFVEIMPYAMVGGDYMELDGNMEWTDLTDDENKKTTVLYIQPGFRASFQVAYPFAIFVKAGFDILVNSDDNRTHYNYINLGLDEKYRHKSGLFAQIGFRYAF